METVTSANLLIGTASHITQVTLDLATGATETIGQSLPATTCLSLTRDTDIVWSVSLDGDGQLAAVHTGSTGPQLGVTSTTGGAVPCHSAVVASDGADRTVAVANYTGGNVGVVAVSGGSATLTGTVDFGGESHPHQVLVEGKTLIVSDLGLNCLHLLDRDNPTTVTGRIELDGDAGPRDAVLIGDLLVVALEVGNAVALVELERDQAGTVIGGRQTARHAFAGEADATHPSQIILDSLGRALILNRGSQKLCIVELADGSFSQVTEVDVPQWPMDLVEVDGVLLLAARDGDVVVGLDLSDPRVERFRFEMPKPNALALLA